MKEYHVLRLCLNNLYFYPVIYTIIFISIFIEIILTNKVLYGVYTLFCFPIIFCILRCFNEFHSSTFFIDVCLVDYLQCKYDRPRYPMLLWVLVQNPDMWFGVKIGVPEEEFNIYTNKLNAMREKYTRHKFTRRNT